MASSPLIGREHPVALLRAEVDRLLDSHGGLVFVTGEAGIGKTTLVRLVAAEAERRGARVLSGSCWAGEGAPGHWPWIQVVRHLARAASGPEWETAAAAVGDELPVLLGERAQADGPASTDHPAFRIQDALTTLLVTAAAARPVLVVLDDLHWADPASLRTLEFLARHAWFEPVLVVGTYRDVEVESPDHPLRPLLVPLLSRATTVRLAGLDRDAVAALVSRVTGRTPGPDEVAEMHRRTGGNPFFVEQTAQVAPGAPVATGVRDAVEQRLALLPPDVIEVLRCASVIGHEFDSALLAAAAGRDVDEPLAHAAAARLVVRDRGDRYAFTHDLVRESLYASLPEERRQALHAAVVGALVALPLEPFAAIAHHARLAVPVVPADEAVGHLLAAARDAGARRAAEEAVGDLRAALGLIPDECTRRRAEVLLQLGDQLDRAGELDAARAVFTEATAAGRQLDDAELIAGAALGRQRLGNPDPDTRSEIDLMDEALSRLDGAPGADAALTARVLAAASMARTHLALEQEVAAELGARAVALARAASDDATLAWCLLARHDSMWAPGTAEDRLEVLDELSAAARRAQDRELEALASFLGAVALLELGRAEARARFATFTALTEQTRLPRHRFLALSRAGAFELLGGRFDAARAAFDDALAFGERMGEVDRERVWRDQVWSLELLRGDVDGALATARDAVPGESFNGTLEAFTAAHRGAAAEALRRESDVAEQFRGMPRRFDFLRLVFEAQVAAATADPQRCAAARAELAPLVGIWAVHSGAGIVWGPMALWAALVDAAEQRWEDAVRGLDAAVVAAERLGARLWSVLARAHLAKALQGRRGPGDAERAAELLAGARCDAAELGMSAALPTVPEAVAVRDEGNVLRFDGGVWTARFAGRTAHVKDAKGLHDLRVLLTRPGVDVAAAELLAPGGDPGAAARRRFGADPMLDERARAVYRDRLRALDGEIRDALDRGADERAARLDHEREALLDELRRAAGLGGRARRLGDDTERARQAVTARIRDTIRRLRPVHPELAEHLAASVATGTYCRYRPEPPVTWTV